MNEEVKIYQFEDNAGNKVAPKVLERQLTFVIKMLDEVLIP